jgi:hypothetical protein
MDAGYKLRCRVPRDHFVLYNGHVRRVPAVTQLAVSVAVRTAARATVFDIAKKSRHESCNPGRYPGKHEHAPAQPFGHLNFFLRENHHCITCVTRIW